MAVVRRPPAREVSVLYGFLRFFSFPPLISPSTSSPCEIQTDILLANGPRSLSVGSGEYGDTGTHTRFEDSNQNKKSDSEMIKKKEKRKKL
ncbi:hypothetical protein EVAR_69343_1 [Eumeta japonica]|uniref:Uncharacterized protein n=1 Tax=Eumeta variegata TaxID=151549 RepID=A0A4C2A2I3_EUMVA|nr:hypothetical protein EVAR_69343_1 [Eumeta japonica]